MDERQLMERLIDAGLGADDVAQAARLLSDTSPEAETLRQVLDAAAALSDMASTAPAPVNGWQAYDARLRAITQHAARRQHVVPGDHTNLGT